MNRVPEARTVGTETLGRGRAGWEGCLKSLLRVHLLLLGLRSFQALYKWATVPEQAH
jgi:hypothetical protein